ncbi:MAG: hypothetical protein HQK50_02495 [Oligoflexia bacterium]|nr:hypothetical protein [Oligoflexia bacterium]
MKQNSHMLHLLGRSLFIIALAISLPARSTEVDSFTSRFEQQEDAYHEVNVIVNELIKKCVYRANKYRVNSVGGLYRLCYFSFADSSPWSKIERILNTTDRIDTRIEGRHHSIYSDFTTREAFALHLAKLGHTLKIKDFIIGSDKLGHFFDTGFLYYKRAFIKGRGVESAMAFGEFQEDTYYGLSTTGIYSYGDLNANFRGMLFWKDLTETVHNEDEIFEPYVLWKDGGEGWVLNPKRPFDINEYLDGGLDEGINCSQYRSKNLDEKVKESLEELSKKYGKYVTCPVSKKLCYDFVKNLKHKNFTEHLVSPVCLDAAKEYETEQSTPNLQKTNSNNQHR